MKFKLIGIALFSFMVTLSSWLACGDALHAEGPRWIGGLAVMREPRQEMSAATLNGKVYILGGVRTDGTPLNSMEVYNPWTNSWSSAAPVPALVSNMALVANADKLYAIGGLAPTPVANVYSYDPRSDTWTARAALPIPRGGVGAAALGGKIYVAGGSSQTGPSNLFHVYDPQANRWTRLGNLPTARYNMAVGVIDGKLYAVGGRTDNDLTLSVVEVYNPATSSWGAPSSMPTGRSDVGYAVYNNELYVFGGEGNRAHPNGVFDVTEIYNPQTNTWRRGPPMLTPRHGAGAAVIGDKIYMPGGAARQGLETVSVHEVLLGRTGTVYFPHIPAGGGLMTEITLTNFSDTLPALGVLEFYDQNGDPASLNVDGRPQNSLSLNVPPYGSVTFRAQAAPNEPIRIVYGVASTDNPLNGSVLFRSGASVAGVGAGALLRRFIMPAQVSASSGENTGLALLNYSSGTASITLTLRNERGTTLGATTIDLPGNHQTARFITDFFPVLGAADFRGTLVATSTAGVAGVAILVSGTQLTSLPLVGE